MAENINRTTHGAFSYKNVPGGPIKTSTVVDTTDTISRDSSRTPGFHHWPKWKPLPYNPFSYSRKTVVTRRCVGPRECLNERGNGTIEFGICGGSLGNPTAFPTNQIDSVRNRAIVNLLNRMKDQKLNLAQTFAERQQTISLIATSATRIANAFLALRKGDILTAGHHLAHPVGVRKKRRFDFAFSRDRQLAVANGWLELQYGWKPLLQDIYGAAELTAQRVSGEVHSKASGSATLSDREIIKRVETGYSPLGSAGKDNVTITIKRFIQAKYVCSFFITNPASRSLSQMGFTNPALLAWELLPYSFVVDWFIPIGNYLSTLDATLGMNFQGGCATLFERYELEETRTGTGQYYFSYRMVGSTYGGSSTVSVKRTQLRSFPRASLPSFKNPLSTTHALNAIALLRNSFKR